MTEDWVTIKEAADIVGRTERTLSRWIQTDKIAHRKEAGRVYVDVSAFRTTEDVILDNVEPAVQLAMLHKELDNATDTIARQDKVIDQLTTQVEFLQALLAQERRLAQPALEEPKKVSWLNRLLGRS